ncbi:queuosine precursor transporter [Micrococcus sp.]|uniref:queuosine precursor transporter n=1 Tax=Micrococcus sp. TaxID=1271 RepID=UPI002A90C8BE|nr:queuosine precursor transporter [Micrococcus sp.]MDY6054704.1 queuosine precursor transporter [Micrococcus sp.]
MHTHPEHSSPDRPASGQGTPAYAEVPHSYYDIFVAVFVALILLSGVTAAKLFYGPYIPGFSELFAGGERLIFDGGAFLFPLSYIIGDILAEVYGFRRARRAILVGFALLGLAALTYWVVSLTTPVEGFEVWDQALAPAPRIALAGLAGFVVGSLVNATIVARMKARMAERSVALRLILSTLVGQLLDTVIFCVIAFGGVVTLAELFNYTATGYIYKCLVEILIVPVTLLVIRWLKRVEPTYRPVLSPEPTTAATA